MKLIATEYDGGIFVGINGHLLPRDGAGMDKNDAWGYRYKIKNTSAGRWAVFDDGDSRLSREADGFIFSSLPSNRPAGFVEDTTWPTPEEALAFLESWRKREEARYVKEFNRMGS